MITTVLAFAGGVISSVVVYKIITIVKKERRKKKALVSDVKRLESKIDLIEMSLNWLKVCSENFDKRSLKLYEIEYDVKTLKSKLEEEENTEDK